MPSFMIKNPTYQELEPLIWVRDNVVDKCPYDGPEKHEAEYRRQINLFFWHVLQSSIYPTKRKKFEKFGSVWVPFSRKLGSKELPMVFGCENASRGPVGPKWNRTDKHFARALEWLVSNVMDFKRYKKKTPTSPGRSREFRIKSKCLDRMYPNRPKSNRELLELTRFYSPLKAVQERFGQTILEMISASANKEFGPRKHDLSGPDAKFGLKSNRDRAARKLYTAVLKKIGPNEIAIDPILEYLQVKSFRGTRKALKQYHQVMSCLQAILSGPVQIVTESPLVIRYYPAYTIAKVGGRLFEQGGGFQSFPAVLKQRCSTVGDNWDMESSQLNIIRKEFEANGIACEFLNDIHSVNDIVAKLHHDNPDNKLTKKLVKICFYGTLFSADALAKSPKSSAVMALRPHFKNLSEVYDFVESWNLNCLTFITALQQLCEVYSRRFRYTSEGMMLTCETGAKYTLERNQCVHSRKVRRRTMSHCISGIESSLLFDAILNGDVEIVYSLEHDGALLKTGDKGVVSAKAKFVVKKFSDTLDFMGDD
ncbi:hypothetical protein pEaSNUABM25_00219 [Erwinia phage pEa_SNUABM_25]|nr:hypothetical protein pEaSNUABM25_00219 [Erwinia phage pEa_SNUABM_25]